MPTPARRFRSAVFQRKRNLERLVRERVVTQSEASQLLASYTQQRNKPTSRRIEFCRSTANKAQTVVPNRLRAFGEKQQ